MARGDDKRARDEGRGRKVRSLVIGGLIGASAAAAARRLRPPRRRRETPAGLGAFESAPCYREVSERRRSRRPVATEAAIGELDRLHVDVGIADPERPSDQHHARRRGQVGVLRLHRLAGAEDEERPVDASLEEPGRAGVAVLHLETRLEVVPLARIEDPHAAAERLRLPLERLESQHCIGAREDDVGERVVALPGSEKEGLVAEQEIIGPAGRRQEVLRLGARGLPLVGLPLEQLRRAVPGPADLEDHERGGQHDRGRGEPPCRTQHSCS